MEIQRALHLTGKLIFMEKEMILHADALDLLFVGRNKEYGAYQIRKKYVEHLGYSLLGISATCLCLFVFRTNGVKKFGTVPEVVEVSLSKDPIPSPKLREPPPPPARVQKPTVPVAKQQFTQPRITKEAEAMTDPPPTMEELENAEIGDHSSKGVAGAGVEPIVGHERPGTAAVPSGQTEEDNPLTVYEAVAEFPGGKVGWTRYLERNLNNETPSEAGAPAGRYTVILNFMVDKKGRIVDVVAENDPKYGTAEEAVRVLKKCPNWKPAMQNGRAVDYRVRQAITFIVE